MSDPSTDAPVYAHAPVNFVEFLDQQDREGSIPIDVGDKRFYVRSPTTLNDDEFLAVANADEGDNAAVLDMAKACVDDYDGLTAALAAAGRPGGCAAAIMALIGEQAAALMAGQGVGSVGESGASSGS